MPKDPIKAKLKEISDKMLLAKPGSKEYNRLMKKLDEICGTQEKGRDAELEKAWEKAKK